MAIYRSKEPTEFVTPRFTSPKEVVQVVASAATGTVNFDVANGAVLYYTSNASGNWTLNVRGSSTDTLSGLLPVGESFTITFLATNGSTPYYQSAMTIDGSAVTPKWLGGVAPSAGSASSVEAYSFTIVKTASTPTYVVLASVGKFA